MRRPFVAGNWKMNLNRADSEALAKGIAAGLRGDAADVGICPPSPYLDVVTAATKGTSVGVGVQNLYHEPSGAYTGEI